MKLNIKIFTRSAILIFVLSGCAPTEGYTNVFPDHVLEVIEQFESSGYKCDNATVYLSNGNAFMDSDYAPDGLTCNESDSNTFGDEFKVFESVSEANNYYVQSCNDRPNGWFHGDYMISPTVSMDSYEKTIADASKFSKILGYPAAQDLGFSCEYMELTW